MVDTTRHKTLHKSTSAKNVAPKTGFVLPDDDMNSRTVQTGLDRHLCQPSR